jgi:hypothetical protein
MGFRLASVRSWRRAAMALVMSLVVVAGSLLLTGEPAAAANVVTSSSPRTLAQLRVVTGAPTVGHRVRFSPRGSRVAAGAHMRSVRIAFGDGSSRRLLKLSAHSSHIYRRVGVYHARLIVTDSTGRRSIARRNVTVGAAKNRVQLRSSAARLKGSRVTGFIALSASRERFTLAAGTSDVSNHRTLVIGKSALLPHGLIAIVDSKKRLANGALLVRAHDGALSDAYRRLAVASNRTIGDQVELSTPTGLTFMASASAVPFTCDRSAGDAPIQVTADLTRTTISTVIYAPARMFSFSLISRPTFTVGVEFSGSASCHLAHGFGLNVPIPSVPGLVVSVGPYFALSATGSVSASATWAPSVFMTVSRAPHDDQKFLQFNSHVSAAVGGSAAVTLKGGIAVTLSVGRSVGLEVKAGPQLTATASRSGPTACANVDSEIELSVELFAHMLFADATVILYDGHYFHSNLLHSCTTGNTVSGSGTATPPQIVSGGSGIQPAPGQTFDGQTIPETAGGTARTWTNYASAGGTEGPTVGVQQTIGVACRILGFRVADGNTWWYQIGSSPWSGVYFVSADAFYNNGQTSGALKGTPFVDLSVPICPSSAGSTPTQVTPPPPQTTNPTPAGTYPETAGGITHTWTNYANAGGTEGPSIGASQTVQITCRVPGFQVADGNTWWYRIASSPWGGAFYASADAFYNNGQTSGSLRGTPWYDPAVPDCSTLGGGGGSTPPPPPPPPTWAETAGGVAHTWTNYTNAGGTQGPSIASGQTVAISCKLQGFRVADGNTWWYRIHSAPWSDAYYVSADAFYNNGATSGSLSGTPFVDQNVANC